MELIVIALSIFVIVYTFRKSGMKKNIYTVDHRHSNISSPSNYSSSDNDKLNKLKQVSERLVYKTQDLANRLSSSGLTPSNRAIISEVRSDWRTINSLQSSLGHKTNSLYIIMGGQRQPFSTYRMCMQGFISDMEQAIKDEERRS